MTSHDISHLTTLPQFASPHNQAHYFISPRNQPQDITYHITADYIATTDAPPKHNQPAPKRHHESERLKAITKNSVWASRWLVALRTFYTQLYSLFFFSLKLRPRLARELLVCKYNMQKSGNYLYINTTCKKTYEYTCYRYLMMEVTVFFEFSYFLVQRT